MFSSEMLEVAIGVVFVYLVLSLICTAINELIASVLALRAKTLEAGIRNLLVSDLDRTELKDSDLEKLHKITDDLFKSHWVQGLAKQGWFDRGLDRVPGVERKGQFSYIEPRTFALALLDAVVQGGNSRNIADVKTELGNLPQNSDLTKTMLFLIDEASNDLDKTRENLENWFNQAMERVSGWYKRKMQLISLILALLVTLPLNADTLMIYQSLSTDATVRAAVVEAADQLIETATAEGEQPTTGEEGQPATSDEDTPLETIDELRGQLDELGIMGWSFEPVDLEKPEDPRGIPDSWYEWLTKIIGLLLTTGAVSLGAPFWFDVLKRIMNIRAAGKPPEEEKKP